ncbi:MarR family transcriptional regulator [Halovulum dunhuangense]|uniref:MarR family transcriptional regulator n=1 Tax=Halovulum dunhuangense TaxID=1505036 RepID=A0A849KYH3_9RHOB|nr:MarR family transcriptional regulator [Halovulum dunhuangense]NNU79226.1 MarR family transcriptional regulator [Halovulum dunhuangense]
MNDRKETDPLAIGLFSEIATVDQLMRARLSRALPRGMELSHFTLLNYLAGIQAERTPAQLARVFHVTKAAMTNTLGKMERAGYVHIRPDWDDARRKFVAISPAGLRARDHAISNVAPLLEKAMQELGPANVRAALPFLRRLRTLLSAAD